MKFLEHFENIADAVKFQRKQIDAHSERAPRDDGVRHSEGSDGVVGKIRGKWHNIDVRVEVVAGASDDLNQLLKDAEEGTGNITVEGISGARVLVQVHGNIGKADLVIEHACVKSAVEDGTEERITSRSGLRGEDESEGGHRVEVGHGRHDRHDEKC